jgi:hypothetical protein
MNLQYSLFGSTRNIIVNLIDILFECKSVHSKGKGAENRDLVICNNCMWSVSLLKGSQVFDRCPACNSKHLEVIPVEDYEDYKLEVSQKTGLSIEFNGEDLSNHT